MENLDIYHYKSELKNTRLLLEITKKIAGLKNLSGTSLDDYEFVTENIDGDRGSLFLNDAEILNYILELLN